MVNTFGTWLVRLDLFRTVTCKALFVVDNKDFRALTGTVHDSNLSHGWEARSSLERILTECFVDRVFRCAVLY